MSPWVHPRRRRARMMMAPGMPAPRRRRGPGLLGVFLVVILVAIIAFFIIRRMG